MKNKHSEDLSHIRSMMEQSSRFISLSGLSGIVAGSIALGGAVLAYLLMQNYEIDYFSGQRSYPFSLVLKLLGIAAVVLGLSIGFGLYFTIRKSRSKNLKVWSRSSRQMLWNLLIPLVVGAVFCFALIHYQIVGFIAPSLLIFYGLSLINASKFTYGDVRFLGYAETLLGLISLFALGYGLIFWALGFGVFNIVYGIIMYKKYE